MHALRVDKQAGKKEIYESLLPQIRALIEGEEDTIANLANICAALKEAFNWWWIGFYFVKNEQLVLGPFQGPVACTRIAFGKGVCGKSWESKQTVIVPDVERFPGHIACSGTSRSEIVLPVFGLNRQVVAVLDVDSEYPEHFDAIDQHYLEELLHSLKI
ncbi:MAG: GAF domain-containing protein [Bacteroidota bacterium]|nr:GAF domain-containing protein [Bacteroidota bacterium]